MANKQIILHAMHVQRYGYYAVRQQMLKQGASMQDVHKMLAMRLRILGA